MIPIADFEATAALAISRLTFSILPVLKTSLSLLNEQVYRV